MAKETATVMKTKSMVDLDYKKEEPLKTMRSTVQYDNHNRVYSPLRNVNNSVIKKPSLNVNPVDFSKV